MFASCALCVLFAIIVDRKNEHALARMLLCRTGQRQKAFFYVISQSLQEANKPHHICKGLKVLSNLINIYKTVQSVLKIEPVIALNLIQDCCYELRSNKTKRIRSKPAP